MCIKLNEIIYTAGARLALERENRGLLDSFYEHPLLLACPVNKISFKIVINANKPLINDILLILY